MKRLIPLFITIFACGMMNAQDQVDALRYSQTFAGGTARSTAMGGAFGALGGDFSAVSQNPAGLGVYRGSELTFTPELYYSKTSSRFNGKSESDYKYNFNFNNFGYVSAFHKKGNTGFIGGAFAFGFNRLNNFHDNILIEGVNKESSLAQSYVESANYGNGNGPVSLNYLDAFSEWLFYDSWVMDQDSNGYYYLNPAMLQPDSMLNLLQRNTIKRSGKINEWVFSAGFNFGNILYIGGTFGILPLDYNEVSAFSERDNGNNSTLEYFRYNETLTVQGTGYTGKFGIIVKPVPQVRIGAAIHLPTSFYLNEVYDASMRSAFVPGTVYPVDESGNPIDNAQYSYRIVTPAKFIGSLGLTFGKFLILSSDIEYINYAGMRLRDGGDGYDFSNENQTISDIYRKNINVKSGAEFRFDNFYMRGGFGYYGSPYQKDEPNYDAYRLVYSGGLGFRNDKAFIDLALSYMTGNERLILYQVESAAKPISSELDYHSLKSMITFGFRF
jgi:hypothetical protein